jgi:LmbE family N-acetylglucosaminyl deacetylase
VDPIETPDNWESSQRILVILAHPDDPEFFCGGSIARWTHAGHQVSYCLLTCGEKGTDDRSLTTDALCTLRQAEQNAAAAVLGVNRVQFLDYPDGYLVPDIQLRRDITRLIREEQPDVLVTCDPTNLYVRETYLNHPDHRSLPAEANVTLDVTEYWEMKLQALYHHKSQIGDAALLEERMRSRHTPDSTLENPRYEEKFKRLILG